MTTKQVRKLWIKALRSGKYKQTKGYLRITKNSSNNTAPRGYCCLGVLCDLAIKRGIIKRFPMGNLLLGPTVQKWAGLEDNDGSYGRSSLAQRNDRGLAFSEIADIIESEPKGLLREPIVSRRAS